MKKIIYKLLGVLLFCSASTLTNAQINAQLLGRYSIGTYNSNGGVAEISAYDPGSKRMFVINGPDSTVKIVSIANPASPVLIATISVKPYGIDVTSVACNKNGVFAIAVIDSNGKTNPSNIVFLDINGNYINKVKAGANADHVIFTSNGQKLLVANEGEPNVGYTIDPEGSISIIDLSAGAASLTQANVQTAGFTAFNSPAVIDSKIRIFGKIQSGTTFLRNSTVAEDLEPEYIAISDDNTTAWVTCQENNALAVVNINTATVTSLLPLGYKNHRLVGNGLDPSDRDNGSNGALAKIDTFPVFGMFLPDGISHFKSGSQSYLVTANEGDARADWGTANNEENRVGDAAYVLDTTKFGGATGVAAIKANSYLGRLTVSNRTGDFNNDGKIDSIFCFGTRSFSIWNGTTGALVWDSKDEIEQKVLSMFPANFNTGHTTNALDDRSDNKGPEPESVTVGKIKDSTYAFVALERIGGIMIYNITNPTAPYFVQYINTRNFSVTPNQTNLASVGDLGPEGIVFIPASESPNGVNMIMLSNEVSGTVALFNINTPETEGISKLQDYKNNTSAAIGTFQGINYKEAGFSTLFPIPNTNGTEFWTCSDRGVNIDCANANTASCRPTYDKMYAFPSYSPKIHRIRIAGDSIQILQTITIKRPNGTGATGIINPTGLGSTAAEIASTDTVLNCANFSLKTTPKDTFGIDPEGLVVDKNGNFWLCEEGGATIWKLNQNGVLVNRFTPYAHLAGKQAVDIQIDSVFKYRKNNRGFEGISIAPNGKIYAMIQSGIQYPTATIGDNTRIHRILEIDPATNNQRMLVYLNDGIIGTGGNQIRLRDWKIGDMAAVNDSTFLVLEAAARGTSDIKRLYQININQATAVHSGLYGSLTLEGLVDTTGLANNGIKPVTKTLVMDLLASGWPAALDKAEGLAIINDSTIAIGNDNDFGQTSPLADGIATATGNLSHLITYRLSGAKKLANYKPSILSVSSQSPYLKPLANGVQFTSLLTAGDVINGYKMAGTPDGSGAFDNNNGTFTMLISHEFGNTVGAVRAHGAKGAFVSKWVIDKNNLSIVSGADLIQRVNLYTPGVGYTLYNSTDTTSKKAFNRFCSSDLPAVSAFYNATTSLGTQERIFMNGEEAGNEGRAFGHIATGTNAGTTYELPALGKFSWENSVANPATGNKTVVAGTDDATPGQVYIYIGDKTNSGTEVDKAGLTNGNLYGIAVNGLTTEVSASFPAANTNFTLVSLGNVKDSTGTSLNTRSNTLGVTNFLRPEDASWDPKNASDLYFVTTNGFGSPSRLWRLHFNNLNDLTLGGTVTALLDGTEGQQMLDNLTLDNFGHVFLQEDVGNNVHNGKIWQYTIDNDKLELLAQHDTTRFIAGGVNYLTQDEESSGIIDVQDILGKGNFLLVDQAHYAVGGDQVEGGQILKMFNPTTANSKSLISIAEARALTTSNDTVRVRGVITRAWGRFIYIQDSTGAIGVRQSSGAMVDSITNGNLKEGDSVEVYGAKGEFNNYAQLQLFSGAYSQNSKVVKLATNVQVPAPVLLTVKQINQSGEQYESKVVRIVGLRTSATAATFAASTNNTVWDGASTGDTTLLRIISAADTEIEDPTAVSVPKGAFIFEGILGQFCSSPTNGCALGYQLYGVRKKDIIEIPLSVFNLINPSNNSRIVTDSASTANVQVNWTKSTNATLYKWMLTSQAGTFTAPLLILLSNNAGVDSTLTLTSGSVDAILASLGIAKGDSVNTKWTVFAYKSSTDSLQASQVFNLTLARSKVVLGAFNLSNPANNTTLVVTPNSTTPVVINWTASANATKYAWKAATLAGNFNNPIANLNADNAGADTKLTLTHNAIDGILVANGVAKGDSIKLQWTVYASRSNDSLKAIETFNITLVRGPGVSVNNIDFKNNINVYPNPAQTELFINSNNITGNMNLKLYSITGQLLIEENMEASITNKINVSNLQDGIYMLSIAGNNGKNATIKVVITH